MSSRERLLVDDQHDGAAGGAEPGRRFAHEAGGVGLCVGDEHELVRAVQGGAGGRRVKARAAVEHEGADVVGETLEQGAVGALVELLGAVGVGGRGGDHQAVGAAAELGVERGGAEASAAAGR